MEDKWKYKKEEKEEGASMVELGLEPDNDTVYVDEGQFISNLNILI